MLSFCLLEALIPFSSPIIEDLYSKSLGLGKRYSICMRHQSHGTNGISAKTVGIPRWLSFEIWRSHRTIAVISSWFQDRLLPEQFHIFSENWISNFFNRNWDNSIERRRYSFRNHCNEMRNIYSQIISIISSKGQCTAEDSLSIVFRKLNVNRVNFLKVQGRDLSKSLQI